MIYTADRLRSDLRRQAGRLRRKRHSLPAVCGARRSIDLRELVLAYAADGAYPVVGQVFKLGAGRNPAVGIAYGGVIDPVADFANVFVHSVVKR